MKHKIKPRELVHFLRVPRTASEIARHFGMRIQNVERYMRHGGRRVLLKRFLLTYPGQERTYKYCEQKSTDIPKVNERDWFYRGNPKQPYLQFFLPRKKEKQIIIAVIPDAHYGCVAHKSEDFDRYLEWIRATPNVYAIGIGDLLENTHHDSPPSALWHQTMRPKDQVLDMIDKLTPLAHKILFMLRGNHEARSSKKVDLDPSWIVCKTLGIPYFSEPVYADFFYNGNVFSIFAQHGTSGGRTKGGRLNAAMRPLAHQGIVHCCFMGHVHDPLVDESPMICRERKYDKKGKIISIELVHKKRYIVIVGSFLEFFGTYASSAGYAPPGCSLHTLMLYEDGSYYVRSYNS